MCLYASWYMKAYRDVVEQKLSTLIIKHTKADHIHHDDWRIDPRPTVQTSLSLSHHSEQLFGLIQRNASTLQCKYTLK